MKIKTVYRFLSIMIVMGLLTACGESNENATEIAAQAKVLKPADEEIAAIYDRSCKACHTVAGGGAPLTGDRSGWKPRMDKGMDQLIDNVVAGFGGMPPFGMCMDCDAEQFEELIHFMAGGE